MEELEKKIKQYEPLLYKLLYRFKVKKDYEDVLQQLRIKIWEFFKYFKVDEKKQAKEFTVLYKSLCNKLVDILKSDYRIKIKKDGIDIKDLSEKEKTLYYLNNPTRINPILTILDYGSASNLRYKLDFELFYKKLKKEDKDLLDLLKKHNSNKIKIAKELKCTKRTVNRRLEKIKNKLNQFLIKGELNG